MELSPHVICQWLPCGRYLVDPELLGEFVEHGVHVVEQRDDLHRLNLAADVREADDVREQDRHLIVHLNMRVNDDVIERDGDRPHL